MALRAFTATEVAEIVGATLLSEGSRSMAGLAFDSRNVREGNLFAALKGTRTDGHDHVLQAVSAGAAAVLVEREVDVPDGTGIIKASSVDDALKILGAEARARFGGRVVGIVGSCGKTTTKNFTTSILEEKYRVDATRGNFNNLQGLPFTILNADIEAQVWVLELGISKPDEMEELAPIARPDSVVFTTIQPVHTEFFESLESIWDEKVKVLNYRSPGGFVILNADDPLMADLALPADLESLTYGTSGSADVHLEFPWDETCEGVPLRLHHGGGSASGLLPLPGRHQAMNFAAACSVGLMFGVNLEAAMEVAGHLKPADHRGVVLELPGDVLLYDDSYNANPTAMVLALRTVAAWSRPVIAVLGEMRELDLNSPARHREVGVLAAKLGVSALLAVGSGDANELLRGFEPSGRPCLRVDRWQDGESWVRERIRGGEAILVKASRAVGLDGLVDRLAEGGAG